LYFGRFAVVHIGGPSSNQAASLESQQIQQIQLLFGRTLRKSSIPKTEIFSIIQPALNSKCLGMGRSGPLPQSFESFGGPKVLRGSGLNDVIFDAARLCKRPSFDSLLPTGLALP
jgi:hypothetical protein